MYKQHDELDDSLDYLNGFYKGVVETRTDADENKVAHGRVKVRVFGVHGSEVPLTDLLWAEVMGSTSMGGNIAGVGISSVLREGTYVWIFFEEGDFNKPVIFGTMIGTQSAINEEGFQAETPGDYVAARIGESDLHPFARSDSSALLDTTIPAHQTKNETIIAGVAKTPYNGGTWDEPPELSSSAVYPDNNVIETHSGHIIEIDDTLGNERIQILHKTGSYIEIRPDGSVIAKSQVDHYKIVQGNDNTNIVGNEAGTTEGDADKHINGNATHHVDGTRTEKIIGLMTIDADGKLLINGDVKIVGGGVECTGKVSAGGGVTTTGEIADSQGNLSSLRSAFDGHNHLYQVPAHPAGNAPTDIPTTTDPLARDSDYVW